jgi:two-component system sensor histidine kinase KdpD
VDSGLQTVEDSVRRAEEATPGSAPRPGHRPVDETALSVFAVAAATGVARMLRSHVAPANLVAIYLLGVVFVAVRCSRKASVLTSLLSVAAFDFFCVPPYLTFRVHDYEYLLTFAGMLVVALVVSAQTARIRRNAEEAALQEARNEALYHLSRLLAGQTRVFDVARIAAEYAEKVVPGRVVVFLPEDGKISFRRRTSDQLLIPRFEEAVAQWVFDHGERAGYGTRIHEGSTALYVPLKGAAETLGVMAVVPASRDRLPDEQTQLLEVLASQTAIAIERTRSQHAADAARAQMQNEQMRSSLLSAVSHDLRTPLASITGAASTLRAQGDKLDAQTRQELLDSIADEAERLSRLVSNLLDMTRLQSGVELRRDLYPLEEIAGAALQRIERQLGERSVVIRIPGDLPLVYVDDVLLGQLLVNLLENAIKYTPPDSPIEIEAEASSGFVVLEIRDRGPGFPPGDEQRIFEKFYRGKTEGTRGAGLGLAICRAVIEAHRGTIEAFNRAGGGAVFRVRIPLPEKP